MGAIHCKNFKKNGYDVTVLGCGGLNNFCDSYKLETDSEKISAEHVLHS